MRTAGGNCEIAKLINTAKISTQFCSIACISKNNSMSPVKYKMSSIDDTFHWHFTQKLR